MYARINIRITKKRLDVIGTVSLLPDISFLWPDAWSLKTLLVARASRAARSGTRSAKVRVRVVVSGGEGGGEWEE